MYIVCNNLALHRYIVPQKDHLFVVDEGGASCFYLILRELEGSSKFRLLTRCEHVCFASPRREWINREWRNSVTQVPKPAPNALLALPTFIPFPDGVLPLPGSQRPSTPAVSHAPETTYLEDVTLPRSDVSLFLSDLQDNVTPLIRSVREQLQIAARTFHSSRRMQEWFPGIRKHEDILQVFQGLLNEEKCTTPRFFESYEICLGNRFFLEDCGDFIVLQVEPEDWNSIFRHLASAGLTSYTEWEYSDWSSGREDWVAWSLEHKTRFARVLKSDLKASLRGTMEYRELAKLSSIVGHTEPRLSELQLVQQYCDVGNKFVATSRWPREIVHGFDIDGRTFQVEIA